MTTLIMQHPQTQGYNFWLEDSRTSWLVGSKSLWTALSQALCWKKIQWLNDYHPVALTSLVMKWFEELVLALNRKGVPPLYINTSFLTGKKVNRGWHFTGPSHRPVTAVSMDVVTYYSSNLNTSYQAGYEAYTLPQPQMCFW